MPSALVLGDATRRAPHIAAIALPGVRSDVIVNGLAERGVYLSSGAACQSRSSRRSHVLQGLGVSESYGVIRISPGRFTSADAIHQAREVITNVIEMYT